MKIINIKENPELQEIITNYFVEHWASDDSKMVYVDCIEHAKDCNDSLSNWYLLLDEDKVIGCAGLITNDFVSRMDLYPYLCALYIEEEYRGNNYGKLLINKIKEDTLKLGYDNLYLVTDHIGYYEHFDFEFIGTGYHPWGETSRIYKCNINRNKYDLVKKAKALVDDSLPLISNLSNLSRLIKESFSNVSWAGFYLTDESKNMLVLGPYQGPLACTRIPFNRGVCGVSAATKETLVVPNVHEFAGHIACSSLSNSEIVTPIIKNDEVIGVIDLDSNLLNNFIEEDKFILEEVANIIASLVK